MTSNTTPNPYEPPTPIGSRQNRLSSFVELLRGIPWTAASRFSRGEMVIVDGIAFYLDPNQSSIAFAASPSATNTDQRMNLIVSEAIRVLPKFLADNPNLTGVLRRRKLAIRMLDDYSGSPDAVIREEVLDWDILSAIIEGDSD